MPKIGKPPPLPPGLAPPETEKTNQPSAKNPLSSPPSYDESLKMPPGPPPGWHNDSLLPSTPPPSYDEALKAPPGPPPPDDSSPLPSAPPPSYEESKKAPALSANAMDNLAAATALLEGAPTVAPSPEQTQVETIMRQLDGIKGGSTLANYTELGLGAAASALNSAGLLDAYVVACNTLPVAQGATTALSVLDGIKVVYDHQKIGDDLKSRPEQFPENQIVAELLGSDLMRVDRAMVTDFWLASGDGPDG